MRPEQIVDMCREMAEQLLKRGLTPDFGYEPGYGTAWSQHWDTLRKTLADAASDGKALDAVTPKRVTLRFGDQEVREGASLVIQTDVPRPTDDD